MPLRTIQWWVKEFKEGRINAAHASGAGRPSTSTDENHITRVQEMIMADRRITEDTIAGVVGISHGTCNSIVHDHLSMSKVSSRWVPKNLSLEQKQLRVSISRAMLTRLQREGDSFLDMVVTEDESWFHLFAPETKRQSMQWKHHDSPPHPKKFRVQASADKVLYAMFWDRHGLIFTYPVPKGAHHSDRKGLRKCV